MENSATFRISSGFSLVELSIVLVILGLLVGGVLSGQSLIRAAELRAVTSEYSRYATSVHTFRDKYFAIPGDMPNATQFWGDNNSLCADGAIPNGTPGTCNGDGNGQVITGTVTGATGEMFQFWTQLAAAGLIEGTYTGSSTGGAVGSTPDVNTPRSRMSNGAWTALYRPAGAAMFFSSLDLKNCYQFGRFRNASSSIFDPLLLPEEAWNLDSKVDDGKANQGKVRAIWWDECTTAANAADNAAEYLLTERGRVCALAFVDVI